MSFRVRSSKFRHVFGSANKKESCYEGIKISKNAHDNNFCEVNPKFLSVVTESAGGGSFLVLPLEKVGRVDANSPKVCGHTGPILDIKWNPFNDNVIASASDDATVKLWSIPDNGLQSTLSDWMVDLHGHTRRVGYLDWHPTAENILLSAGYDFNCILWNVETAEPVNILSVHPDNIFSIAWNHDGSLFATTCKDKNLRVVDPRQGNIVSECSGHQGTKASKVKFLGNKSKLFCVGFSKHSERQYGVWDMRHMTKPLRKDTIDSSSGVMFPFCDYDNNVVFVAGKGDGNIRYFEVVDDAPFIHYLSQYQSGSPQRGLGVMPKRGLDTSRCELMRFYKLHSVKALVEPISMIVPRKSEMFQDDIYPPTNSMLPSLSSDEWISGSNRDPILMSLKDGQIISSTRSSTGKAVQRKQPAQPSHNELPAPYSQRMTSPTNTLTNCMPRKITVLRAHQVKSAERFHSNSVRNSLQGGNSAHAKQSSTVKTGQTIGSNKTYITSNKLHQTKSLPTMSHPAKSHPSLQTKSTPAVSYQTKSRQAAMNQGKSHQAITNPAKSPQINSYPAMPYPAKSLREVRSAMTTGCTQRSPPRVVTKVMGAKFSTPSSSTSRAKDGGIVPTPTITTYKAVKRGQSVTEAPPSSVKRSSPMAKAASVDQPQKVPASVKNIAKLSDNNGERVDVFNKIGLFEKKNQQDSPPDRNWSHGQKEPSPEKQWTTGYQSSVKTEVRSPTQSNLDESPPPATIHQPVMSANQDAARPSSTLRSQDSPVFDRPDSKKLTSNTPVFQLNRGISERSDLAVSDDDSDTLSPDNELATSHMQQLAKKRGRRTHSYRRRRENKILNESSDQDTFSTPPTSPAVKTKAWNENPMFETEAPVDISALDDALHDFELLSKSFHSTAQPIGSKPGIQSNHTVSSNIQNRGAKPTVSNALSKSEKHLEYSSQPAVPKEEIVASKSMTNIGSALELQRDNKNEMLNSPYVADGSQLSSKLSQSSHVIHSYASSPVELTSPEAGNNSESTEMIDFINTDAPDNTLIKPSKLRASMKSKRRHTQEIMPGRRSSLEHSPSPGPHRHGSHSPSPGPPSSMVTGLVSKSQIQFGSSDTPEEKWNGSFHRAGSLREKLTVKGDSEPLESSLKRAQSLRDHSRSSNAKQKQLTIVEMKSGTKASPQELNNNSYDLMMSGKISPRTVSRPLQLALDMGTPPKTSNSPNLQERSHSMDSTSPISRQQEKSTAQRQDSFKSSTKVQLNSSPVNKQPQSPVQMYSGKSSRVQAHSPVDLVQAHSAKTSVQAHSTVPLSPPVQMHSGKSSRVQAHSPVDLVQAHSPPVQSSSLLFNASKTQERTSPNKFVFSPTEGSNPSMSNSFQGSFPDQLKNGAVDVDNLVPSPENRAWRASPVTRKIHVKKVWSPRSPSQSEPVLENGDSHAMPATDPELRKAYFRQLEEIQSLKQQITFKDKRIRQLEEELSMLRLPNSPEVGESTC